jgi:hypothetical protein
MVFLASVRCCDALVHSVDGVSFVPDDRPRTQLDLLCEASFAYAGIDEGLSHTRHVNDLRQEEEVRGSTKKKYAGWSFVDRPTKKPSVCRVC